MTEQVVHVRVNDAGTGRPTPVRLRFATPEGRYLAPLGRLAEFPTAPRQDVGGHLQLGDQRYAYIDGTCEIRLPAGPLAVEISKGPEYTPIRQTIVRRHGQIALRFSLERRFDPQAEGWYAGDTQVFLLGPAAAWLEGAAEGLHIVNVLAAEWREPGRRVLTNILDFSGQEPALARDGCLVAVNTQNRHDTLGWLTLLNCHRIVHPLALPQEGFEAWTLFDWCGQCHRKGGLVVWPAFPDRRGELVADLILGGIDAVEWTEPGSFFSVGLPEWYRWLDCGFRVPIVGGSGKASNTIPVGLVRTYAQLDPGQELTYARWIEAVRRGRTFATRGPLVRFTVNGQGPGASLPLPETTAEFSIQAAARSVVPFEELEVVANGAVLARASAGPDLTATLTLTQPYHARGPSAPVWLAARCVGAGGLLAHTSPVYLRPAQPAADPQSAEPFLTHLIQLSQWAETHVSAATAREHLHVILTNAQTALRQRLAPPRLQSGT